MSSPGQIEISQLKELIPSINECAEIIHIQKGYSTDHKYMVTHKENRKCLLRVFNHDQFESKESEYRVLQHMERFDVKCSRPLEMGKLTLLGKAYMLLTYIEGCDAIEGLPNYSDHEQFDIGVEAGKELLKMHQYQAPANTSSWYDRKLNKHKRYIDEYLKSGVKVKNDTKIMTFIEENIGLMKHRPNLFQHDDFHVGNIVLKNKQLAGVIDFNRFDWGDPIHEFLKVGMFSREISIPFSVGQIKGYHRNNDPGELFWKLYSVYLAMCLFSSVVWIMKVKPEELTIMLDKIDLVLDDHQCFEKVKPRWYEIG